MAKKNWDYDCAVIGGGPGGLVSSVYLRRFRRSVALIQSGKPRASWIPRSHNIIGFHKGVSGNELLRRLSWQVKKLGADRFDAEAQVLRLPHSGFLVQAGGESIRVPHVILATGIEDIHPQIENLIPLREKGLLRYCPICDAFEHKGEAVSVLVQDEDGVERALFMSRYTGKLTLVIPHELKLKPSKIREIRECRAQMKRGKLTGIEPAGLGQKGVWVHVDGHLPFSSRVTYVELGSRVLDSAFRGLKGLKRSDEGLILTTQEQRCSIPGLFAVGDCVNQVHQIVIAAGHAAVATTTIHNDLMT